MFFHAHNSWWWSRMPRRWVLCFDELWKHKPSEFQKMKRSHTTLVEVNKILTVHFCAGDVSLWMLCTTHSSYTERDVFVCGYFFRCWRSPFFLTLIWRIYHLWRTMEHFWWSPRRDSSPSLVVALPVFLSPYTASGLLSPFTHWRERIELF